ncbi:phenylacetate--CoA ligase family protein [Mitsuokella multacida]|uniref:phenylacetate--CoA ligase family protein n=2 Tax=Mitsuokella multacida TaxID=52226 RepID=UPI0024910F7C|nr:hypothetical protein [Mitsuokella multacida]
MFANPSMEQIAPARLQELQQERLPKTLRWAAEKCAHYRELFAARGLTGNALKELKAAEDLQALPLLRPEEMAGQRAFDFLTMPLSSLLRISCMKAGGEEEFVHFLTNGDIAHNIEQVTRSLVACGLHNATLAAVLGDGADSRLMDVHYALEFIGAATMMLGAEPKSWPEKLAIVTPETLIGTPERILALDDALLERGSGLSELPLARILCLHTAVPAASTVASLNAMTSAKVYHMLALPELGTAAPFLPCEPGELTFHLQEDYALGEVIDPQTAEPSGSSGELVLTTLAAEAMPLVRLRTGLLVEPIPAPCACGRTLRRFRVVLE